MNNSIKIYEEYLKPREKEYEIGVIESKKINIENKLFETLSLEQRKLFEEYLFLSKQIEHKNNEDLIKFVLEFINKKTHKWVFFLFIQLWRFFLPFYKARDILLNFS